MSKELESLFRELGLSENESTVLSVLFQYTNIKVSELSRRAKLNRTTTYGVVKNLMKKGLATSVDKAGVTEYQSIDPEALPSYIDRQQSALEQKKIDLEKMIPKIKKIQERANFFPHVLFFEGIEGLKQAYEDTLRNNTNKLIQCFTGPDAIYDLLGNDFINYYVKKRASLGIICNQIAADSAFSQKTQLLDEPSLRHTLIIPQEFALDTEFIIYDNKLAILSFSKEKPLAVLIEDENISNSLKTLFRYAEKRGSDECKAIKN